MKKLILNLFFIIFLTGCFQNTAMVGPTMTLVSTGNFTHAFGAYVTNKAVEEETGMQTLEYLSKKVEEQHINILLIVGNVGVRKMIVNFLFLMI